MEVVARLTPPLLSHLRVVLAREHVLHPTGSWEELEPAIRERPVDVVVVDPRADGTVRVAELQALLARFPSLPIVLYTSLAPDTLKATVELAKHGIQHVVLRGFDDEPRRFRELLERQPAYVLGEQVLDRLSEPLGALPPPLTKAIVRLFRAPHEFGDVQDLADAAGMTRRSLDRWLDKLALAPARTFLVGARLARAAFYMRDEGYLLEDVTRKLGYPSPRLFARQVREATGLTPTALRRRLEPDNLAQQLSRLLMRRREGVDSDERTPTSLGGR